MTLDPSFLYPLYDDAALTFWSMQTLKVMQKYQVKWLKWYNDKWADILKCRIEPLDAKQFIEGFPLSNNVRAIHCFGTGLQKQRDSYDEQVFSLGLVYTTGKTQLEGQAANQYGDYRVSGYALQIWNAFWCRLSEQDLTTKEFTAGWPTNNKYYDIDGNVAEKVPSDPPNVVIKTTQFNPDSNISAQLNQQLGLQGYLQLDLLVNPYSVKRPR